MEVSNLEPMLAMQSTRRQRHAGTDWHARDSSQRVRILHFARPRIVRVPAARDEIDVLHVMAEGLDQAAYMALEAAEFGVRVAPEKQHANAVVPRAHARPEVSRRIS